MPRALPNSPQSQRRAKNENFRALVSRANTEKKIRKYQIACAMNCTSQSLRNKMDDPEKITLGELRRICDLLGWTAEDLQQII